VRYLNHENTDELLELKTLIPAFLTEVIHFVACTLLIFHTPVFNTHCSPRCPHSSFSTLHRTWPPPPSFSLACVLASEFPSPSLSNAFHAGYTALLVFHTLHYTALSLPPIPSPSRAVLRPNSLHLLPRAWSRAQISFPFHFERLPRRPHRTPCFPHPELLLLQTTIYTASKIDFLEAICRLSYNRWRCLATLKFFSKDSKTWW